MIKLFKRLFTMMALNKIIDEMEKEHELLKKQNIEFRNRAIAAETLVLKQEGWLRDNRIDPKPSYLNN